MKNINSMNIILLFYDKCSLIDLEISVDIQDKNQRIFFGCNLFSLLKVNNIKKNNIEMLICYFRSRSVNQLRIKKMIQKYFYMINFL